MQLNTIKPAEGSKKNRRRVGRGIGSGLGKTAGRGHKGQKSRSGGFHKVGFEGGQMPMYRRLPKRGFNKPNQERFAVINLGLIEKFIGLGKLDAKGPISEDMLVAAGLTGHKRDGIRILNKGEIKTAVNLSVAGASAAAIEAIKAAGGSIVVREAKVVITKAMRLAAKA